MSMQCPYCWTEIDDPDDCYEEGFNYEHECHNCEKNFVFNVEYSRHYSAYQAECLNGGEHDYKEYKIYGTGEPLIRLRCQDCQHEVSKSSAHAAEQKSNKET